MRKHLLILVASTAVIVLWTLAGAVAQEEAVVEEAVVEEAVVEEAVVEEEVGFKTFWVYGDKWGRTNHYVPSGWMGDYGAIKMDDNYKDYPYTGMTCIKFTYTGEHPQGAGWVGVYWQNPANNWGYRKGGFDLTGAKKLTFWARGEKGGELIGEFKMGGISGEYPDSDSTGIGPITLTKKWKQYTIDLEGLDLSYISGGFCWSTSRMDNPESIAFYLDDIKYE